MRSAVLSCQPYDIGAHGRILAGETQIYMVSGRGTFVRDLLRF